MTCYSIGFEREDGSFQVLATLNNNDGLMAEADMRFLTADIVGMVSDVTGIECMALNRQDAPDCVDLDE